MSFETVARDCPICMVEIDETVNCVITECGHYFHTKCLMTNAAHNGFDCPYCRSEMTPEIKNDKDDEYDEDFNEDYYQDNIENERVATEALYGMRNMFLVAEGLEPEEIESEESENNEESYQDDNSSSSDSNDEEENDTEELPVDKPSTAFIARKLISFGVTMEDMVKCIINETYHPEFNEEGGFPDEIGVVYGQIRRVITRHHRGVERG